MITRTISRIIVLSFLILSSACSHAQIGIVTGVTTDSAGKHLASKKVYYGKASYTKLSGTTFTYPTGTFVAAPNVNVSLVLTGAAPFAANKSYTPIVTSNTATAATVRVNKQGGGTTSEAATGDVEVQLWAVES